MLFAVGQRLADVNFFKAGQSNNVANAGVFQFHLAHAGESVEAGDIRPLPAAVAMNADDRIAHAHPAADNAPERNAAEIIAVVEIRNEHLKKWLR